MILESKLQWNLWIKTVCFFFHISPRCSLEELMLKLKLKYFGHLMGRADSFEKTLMLEKIEGRRRGRQRISGWMASPTQWTWVLVDSSSWWWTGRPGMLRFMGLQTVRHDWVTELNWTDSLCLFYILIHWKTSLPPSWGKSRYFYFVLNHKNILYVL